MTKPTQTPRTDALLHQGSLADYPELLRQECYLLERELVEAKRELVQINFKLEEEKNRADELNAMVEDSDAYWKQRLAECEKALLEIKLRVCGDAAPHWIGDLSTTKSRARIADIIIADIIDAAIAQKKKP